MTVADALSLFGAVTAALFSQYPRYIYLHNVGCPVHNIAVQKALCTKLNLRQALQKPTESMVKVEHLLSYATDTAQHEKLVYTFAIKAAGPTSTDPIGAPSVLDRHRETVSAHAAYSCSATPDATLRHGFAISIIYFSRSSRIHISVTYG